MMRGKMTNGRMIERATWEATRRVSIPSPRLDKKGLCAVRQREFEKESDEIETYDQRR